MHIASANAKASIADIWRFLVILVPLRMYFLSQSSYIRYQIILTILLDERFLAGLNSPCCILLEQ